MTEAFDTSQVNVGFFFSLPGLINDDQMFLNYFGHHKTGWLQQDLAIFECVKAVRECLEY